MSDIRFDPVTGNWAIVAPNRNERPVEFIPTERIVKRVLCPFCAGNELETPASLACYNERGEKVDDQQPWLVRVFANKYPALCDVDPTKDQPNEAQFKARPEGPYQSLRAHGIQELIIPTSRHLQGLDQLTEQECFVAHLAYRERVEAASQVAGMKHAMLFTNCRSAAGASLEHIHTQLMVTPFLSDSMESRIKRNQSYHAEHGRHQIHALTDWELAEETRVIDQSKNFTVLCPYASRFAFQTWIVPNASTAGFLQSTDSIIKELAELSQQQVKRLESALDEPAYNVLFHLPPFAEIDSQPWFVEIFPRISVAAGFELGTDMWVNPVSPEIAARRLRQCSP